MRLQVKGKNLEISDSIRSYAEQKLRKLDKQLGDLVQVELELARREEPVDPREPGRRGDGLHEGALRCASRAATKRHARLDRRAHGQAPARGEGVPRQAPPRAAPQGGAQRRVIFRRRPLHERLAREGGPARRARARTRAQPWDKAGIHGVHRPREWDDVATLAAELEGERAEFVVLDDEIIVEYGPRRDRDVRRRDLARSAVPRRGRAREDGALGGRRAPDRGREPAGRRRARAGAGASRRGADARRRRRAPLRLDPCAGAGGRLRRPRPAPGRRSLGDRGLATLGDEWLPDWAPSRRFCASAKAGALKRIAEQAEYVLSLQPEFEKLSDAELAGQDGRVQAAARERRVARGAALRGVRRDPRGLPPRPRRSSSSRCR